MIRTATHAFKFAMTDFGPKQLVRAPILEDGSLGAWEELDSNDFEGHEASMYDSIQMVLHHMESIPQDVPKHQDYLDTLDIANALWWFIENISDESPERNAYFFYLRERVREELA